MAERHLVTKTNQIFTLNVDSINAGMNAACDKVYLIWWERANATDNQSVIKAMTTIKHLEKRYNSYPSLCKRFIICFPRSSI